MNLSQYISPYLRDELSRFQFINNLAKMSFGVSAVSALPDLQATTKGDVLPEKRQLININMNGGQSHLDYWDPKEDVDVMNGTETFVTESGVKLGSSLRALDEHMDKIALIRSMTSPEGDHVRGTYLTDTSYRMLGSVKHPGFGAMLSKLRPTDSDLPHSITVGSNVGGAGFLGSLYDPLRILNPDSALKNLMANHETTSFKSMKMSMIKSMSKDFRRQFKSEDIKAFEGFYDDAVRLTKSKSLKAFDLKHEKASVRQAYGLNRFGSGLLLARRLLSEGVSYVKVGLGGWDYHNNISASIMPRGLEMAQGLAAFLSDLEKYELLKKVVVTFTTEFGRTPYVSPGRKGRDHHPRAYSQWIAGAGVNAGKVYGKTDEFGSQVVEGHLTPMDFNATVAHLLGVDLEREIVSVDGRPFTISRNGKVVKDLCKDLS